MLRYLSKAACVAAVCGLAAIGVGCGGSNSDSGTTASGGGAQGKSSVAIGVVGTFTGIPGLPNASPQVMDAWAKSVNAAGGIGGHPVQVIVKDVGTRTGAGRAAVQELIAKDHVVAIVSQDFSELSWAKYAEQQQVPLFEAFAGVGPFVSPDVFPISMSPITLAYGMDAQLKQTGGTGAVGYASEIAAGQQIIDLMKQFSGGLGLKLPVVTKMSSSLPDYTPFCQQLKSAHVTGYVASFGADVLDKITQQCFSEKAGSTPVLVGQGASPMWKTSPAYDGAAVVDSVAPFFDASVPGVKTYRDALQKYAPQLPGSKSDNGTPLLVWAGAQMIAAAGAKVHGDITAASLRSALYTIKDETLGGLIAPATYTEGRTSAIRCWFTWRVSGGSFASTNGAKPTCAPAAAVAPAEAGLAKALGGGK